MRIGKKPVKSFFAGIAGLFLLNACGQDTFYILGPFYEVDNPLPFAEHGTLIKSEVVSNNRGVESWRIVFHSQDVDENDIQSSGVLFVPPGNPPEGGWPVLVMAHGTTGLPRTCAVSPLPFTSLAWNENMSFWESIAQPYVSPQSGVRYAAILPDYQGLGTAGPPSYLLAAVTGKNALDAALAAHELLGNRLSTRTFLWGHSQGGQAAGWAAQIAPSYAPKLNVLGATLLAPAANLTALVDGALNLKWGMSAASASALLMTAIPSFSTNYALDSEEVLTKLGKETQPIVESLCLAADFPLFAIPSLPEPIGQGYVPTDYVNAPDGRLPDAWNAAIAQQDLAQQGQSTPVFLVQGTNDTTIPLPTSCLYFEQACGVEDAIEFGVIDGGTHLTIPQLALPEIRSWMESILGGNEAPSSCSTPPEQCVPAM